MERRYTEPDAQKAFFLEDIEFPLALSSTGDLKTITGRDNVRQALVERVCTRRGELEHRPQYGLDIDDEQGSPNTLLSHASMQANILEQCRREPRVDEAQCTIEATEDDVTAFIEANTKDGENLGAQVSLGR